ncbi:hypothetical protein J2128_001286 [Methanomicrobium sp. W14]|uniref:hypothetical protein n=1 Tax=Methanomicrobium sp. W14 TaxID=2817839 RepID=UPI001AEA0C68|nr:hypothetical protein [Methanomicrobium sp. W14]MBP2133332.1 hypothetical protein [Methanomicrobium sp. W14]
MKKPLLIVLALLAAVLVLSGEVSAGGDTYAKGDTVDISGSVTGSPSQGLAVWVFGPNYWTREIQSVSGDTYTYEIPGSITENMASGQYFCIVQHPMMNGVFDVYVSGDDVVSSSGQSFAISGSGKLQGSSAAYALMNMIDSPDIDDMYVVTEFYITDPWIRFTPEETYYTGDNILISGSTNVAAGEKLIYELYSSSFNPESKSNLSGFSGKSGTVTVEPAGDENVWEVLIDTDGMKPDTYIFRVSKDDGSAAYSEEFTLEKNPSLTVSNEVSSSESSQGEAVAISTAVSTSASSGYTENKNASETAAQPSPGAGWILSMSAFFVSAVALAKRRL